MNALIGMIAIGIAIVLIVLHKEGRFLTVTALIAGLSVVPLISDYVSGALRTADSAVGLTLPVVIAAAATTWVVIELKDRGTRRITPWVALLVPCLWLLAGGPFLMVHDLVTSAVDGAGSMATQVTTDLR